MRPNNLKLRLLRSRFLYPLLLIGMTILVGTVGYYVLEEWSVIESLYMTIITMTTVGYGEVKALSDHGRIFTIILITISIGLAGYGFSTLTAFFVEGEIRHLIRGRRMDKHIARLTNHIILCGAGRTGLHIAEEFHRSATAFVVIEQDHNALQELFHLRDLLYLQQDATKDDTLLAAGIKQASGLITTLSEDKDNIFVALCARSLKPDLRIIARLVDDSNEELLRKAGADYIVSPNAIGGVRMASMMLRPTVVSFLDEMLQVTGQTLRMEEMRVDDFPGLLNRSLGEINIRRRTGTLVVAINSRERGYQFNPGAETVLQSGDILIVIGTEDQLDPSRWASACRS